MIEPAARRTASPTSSWPLPNTWNFGSTLHGSARIAHVLTAEFETLYYTQAKRYRQLEKETEPFVKPGSFAGGDMRMLDTRIPDPTYHGVRDRPAHIYVEESWIEHPTEKNAKVLRELECERTRPHSFQWGYDGIGPSVSAAAILADALGLGDSRAAGIAVDSPRPDEILRLLRAAFCIEVIAQLCYEWRVRRSVILRWARVWYLQCSITELPSALRELPPPPYPYKAFKPMYHITDES